MEPGSKVADNKWDMTWTGPWNSIPTARLGTGVFLEGSTFTMNGGEISGHKGRRGGGVAIFEGTFTMNGGTISNNETIGRYGWGGGVYLNASTFTMRGGSITGNKADTVLGWGGGVALAGGTNVASSVKMVMEGGSISNNEAREAGGGVHVDDYCSFTMKGGEIAGNTVGKDNENVGVGGGGISGIWCAVSIEGGTIKNNTVRKRGYGGGILLNLSASLIPFRSSFEVKDGGVIYGKDGDNKNTVPNGAKGSAAYIYTTPHNIGSYNTFEFNNNHVTNANHKPIIIKDSNIMAYTYPAAGD
jgi:hypothetical protein